MANLVEVQDYRVGIVCKVAHNTGILIQFACGLITPSYLSPERYSRLVAMHGRHHALRHKAPNPFLLNQFFECYCKETYPKAEPETERELMI